MADTRPTKLKLWYAFYLCTLAILKPKQLVIEEEKDNKLSANFSSPAEQEHKAYIIHRAFWRSLGLIIISGVIGSLIGLLLKCTGIIPSKFSICIFQSVGAMLLLWGTLFVRGWEIQSYCGVTLCERVNRWIYISLYCLGTTIIVYSLVWMA